MWWRCPRMPGLSQIGMAGWAKVDMRFLMADVKLCRLPPRLGGPSTRPPQLNREYQCAGSSGWATTERKTLAKCKAHDARAACGMRLTSAKSIGFHAPLGVGLLAQLSVVLELAEARHPMLNDL